MADSIDEVIQSSYAVSQTPRLSRRGSNSNMRDNKISPLPSTTSDHNIRQEHVANSMRYRPSSATQRGQHSFTSEERSSENGARKRTTMIEQDEGSRSSNSGNGAGNGVTDFFSAEVFQIVLHNPTTAHRFLRFCQSRNCGENMEFLQKVDAYNRLLDEVTQALSIINSTYTSPDAPRKINISGPITKRVSSDIKQITQNLIPSLETIFTGAQEHVERLLNSDVYPRFVRHQVTATATMALADHRERYQGLGDCFCLTDPTTADNPIVFASDGFVQVTGYSRRDIIPRNCRFLQGELTDIKSTVRLRQAIDNCEETVELLLNYRKNGDPFWNLLYCSPLLNEHGEVVFFLGGQINCSTTIHSCTDILKVLSVNDDELDGIDRVDGEPTRSKTPSIKSKPKPMSSFFKSFRKYSAPPPKIAVRNEAGMEPELLDRLGRLTFKTQVEAFYTAYSKYLVLQYHPPTSHLLIKHYSPGIIDILSLNLPNGGIAPIFSKEIFAVLASSSSSPSSVHRAFKETVRASIQRGVAVSVETGLLTGYEERKGKGGFKGLGMGMGKEGRERGTVLVRVEERYVTHWTPLKDEEGRAGWVVLTIAPKM